MEYNETNVSSKMKGGVRNVQDSVRPFLLEAVAVVPEVVLGVHRPVVEYRVLPALDDLVPQHHLVHLISGGERGQRTFDIFHTCNVS